MFLPLETTVRQAIDADGNKQYDENQQPKVEPNPESLVKMSEVVNSLALAKAGSRMLIADCWRDIPNRARGRNLGLGANFNTDRLPRQTVIHRGDETQKTLVLLTNFQCDDMMNINDVMKDGKTFNNKPHIKTT
jgi:hypothetical protein